MDISRLNITTRGLPSRRYAGAISELQSTAAYTGHLLPDAYVRLILAADGGHPEASSFIVNNDPANEFDVNTFYSFGDERGDLIHDAIRRWGAVLGPDCFPIGCDGGDNQIYIDFSGSMPSVSIYLHDEGGVRVHVAPDFEVFLSMLHINPDFI